MRPYRMGISSGTRSVDCCSSSLTGSLFDPLPSTWACASSGTWRRIDLPAAARASRPSEVEAAGLVLPAVLGFVLAAAFFNFPAAAFAFPAGFFVRAVAPFLVLAGAFFVVVMPMPSRTRRGAPLQSPERSHLRTSMGHFAVERGESVMQGLVALR